MPACRARWEDIFGQDKVQRAFFVKAITLAAIPTMNISSIEEIIQADTASSKIIPRLKIAQIHVGDPIFPIRYRKPMASRIGTIVTKVTKWTSGIIVLPLLSINLYLPRVYLLFLTITRRGVYLAPLIILVGGGHVDECDVISEAGKACIA